MLFSEPKIPQSNARLSRCCAASRFSALQRAENSSIFQVERLDVVALEVSVLFSEPKIPQSGTRFSAQSVRRVSVLFSEPKIPQYSLAKCSCLTLCVVSVLFSEPKIPQCNAAIERAESGLCFSALQRAENSSISEQREESEHPGYRFSALQRAENSSMNYDFAWHYVPD